jgi:hypothetical protein
LEVKRGSSTGAPVGGSGRTPEEDEDDDDDDRDDNDCQAVDHDIDDRCFGDLTGGPEAVVGNLYQSSGGIQAVNQTVRVLPEV